MKMEGDALDTILNEETGTQTEEVVVTETDDKQVEPEKKEEPKAEDISVKLTELEKANKGLLKELLSERKGRQTVEGKLSQIGTTLSELLKQREEKKATEVVKEKQTPELTKIALDLDENGNAFIKPELIAQIVDSNTPKGEIAELNKKIEGLSKAVEEEKERRKAEAIKAESTNAFEKTIKSILGEAETYEPAYGSLQKAYNWLNDAIVDYQQENEVGELKSSGHAIDLIEESGIGEKFSKAFPDIDYANIVRMYDSKTDLRRALKALTPKAEAKKEGIDKLVKKASQKPSGLGSMKNQKSSTSTLDEIAALSTDDIMGLPDSDIDKIKRLLRASE